MRSECSKTAFAENTPLPMRIGGKYRPIRVIGKGGMSYVYEAEHHFTKDRVALKVLRGHCAELDRTALERFRQETRVCSLVKSEHIVRVFDADVAPELAGAPFLVMDLLAGRDLGVVAKNGPLEPACVVAWLRQVARALDKAHAVGIVHRDLKPENLFLAESESGPIVKVLDFGVAKMRTDDDATRTNAGSVIGTPLYMSPEQASSAPVSARSDVWSVGLIAFRLLSGRTYWNIRNVSLLLADIVYAEIVPPSDKGLDLGAEFDRWFLRSCARDPASRFGSVGEQVEALALALGESAAAHAVSSSSTFSWAGPRSLDGADGRVERTGPTVALTTALLRGRRGSLIASLALGVAAASTATLFWERTGDATSASRTFVNPAAMMHASSAAPLPSASPSAEIAVRSAPHVATEGALAPPSAGEPLVEPPRTLRRKRATPAARLTSLPTDPPAAGAATSPSAPATAVPPQLPLDPLADPH